MLTDKQTARYRELRALGVPPPQAIKAARYAPPNPTLGIEFDKPAKWTVEHKGREFELTAKLEIDEIGDLDFYGTIEISAECPGVEWIALTPPYTDWPDRGRPWFKPACSYEEHRQGARKGLSRGVADQQARDYVNRDLRRVRGYLDGDWHLAGMIVEARTCGVLLGNGSVWGLESDDQDGFSEVAHEMAHKALAEATETLAKLGCNP